MLKPPGIQKKISFDPVYILRIAGKPLSEKLVNRLLSWEYDDYEKVDKLTLTFDNEDGGITDESVFELGNLVEFRHGYINDLSARKFFILLSSSGWKEITIECYEIIKIFDTEEIKKTYDGQDGRGILLGDLVKEIADRNGLKYRTQERKDSQGAVIKGIYNREKCSDMAFLFTLGLHIGYQVWIEDVQGESEPVLFFLPRRYDQAPYMEFTYYGLDGDILDFIPKMSAVGKRSELSGGGVDLETKTAFWKTSKDGSIKKTFFFKHKSLDKNWHDYDRFISRFKMLKQERLVKAQMKNEKDAEDIIAAQLAKNMEDQIEAELHLIGEPHLKSRRVVLVNNVQKYSGKYYVKRVVHTGGDGYMSIAYLTKNGADLTEARDKIQIEPMLVNRKRFSVKDYLAETKSSPGSRYYARLFNS